MCPGLFPTTCDYASLQLPIAERAIPDQASARNEKHSVNGHEPDCDLRAETCHYQRERKRDRETACVRACMRAREKEREIGGPVSMSRDLGDLGNEPRRESSIRVRDKRCYSRSTKKYAPRGKRRRGLTLEEDVKRKKEEGRGSVHLRR